MRRGESITKLRNILCSFEMNALFGGTAFRGRDEIEVRHSPEFRIYSNGAAEIHKLYEETPCRLMCSNSELTPFPLEGRIG